MKISSQVADTKSRRRPKSVQVGKQTAKLQMLRRLVCSDAPEQALRYHGAQSIAGVDEVGRGSLFGPVVAAAVILPECMDSLADAGLRDSKQLTREQREEFDLEIRRIALCISVAEIDAATIDRVNIYQATRLAMLSAVEGLSQAPDHLLIDAMRLDHPCAQTKLIYGDSLSLSIAAASVIAKVHRDAMMRDFDALHPAYGIASHKGYGTPAHRRALMEFGPTPLHRMTFAPVRTAAGFDVAGEEELLFDDGLLDDDVLEELKEGATWV